MQQPPLQTLRLDNFSGGLNLRDAPGELDLSEFPDAMNVTLDERGGVACKLGSVTFKTLEAGSSANHRVLNSYYWAKGQVLATQVVMTDGSCRLFVDTTDRKTFTTTDRIGMADFQGRLYFIHPIDGLFYWDGGAVTAVAGVGAPKGSTLCAWQNYLLAGGDPSQPQRLYRSKLADATVWDTTAGAATNDLREKDQEAIVCLQGGQREDVLGRAQLLVFKRRSSYRVTDASTLAFQTLDGRTGAASALSVVNQLGYTYVLSERGIFRTDGVSRLVPLSGRDEPLFTPTQVDLSRLDLWAAGTDGHRLYFSLCLAGSAVNNLQLVYHPEQNWIAPHSAAYSCYALYGLNDAKLVGGATFSTAIVYQLNKGGVDKDTLPILSWFQTRWYEPAGGFAAKLRKARLHCRGSFLLCTRFDYEVANRGAYVVTAPSSNVLTWNAGQAWNSGRLWGPLHSQDYRDTPLRGTGKAVSFRIEASTTTSATAPALFGFGASPEIGAWSLYGLDLSFVPLSPA